MTGTGRFERSRQGPGDHAQRVEDEIRAAGAQVYFAYLRAREQGVDLLDEPSEGLLAARRLGRRDGGDDAAERGLRTT